MKTFIAIIITAMFTFNVNALEFIGSTKHVECAAQVATALGLQDTDHRVWMKDERLRNVYGYFATTNDENTSALVLNKRLITGHRDAKLTIAHEMVHIMQHLRGDTFDTEPAYHDRKHEIEAFKLEKQLYTFCK